MSEAYRPRILVVAGDGESHVEFCEALAQLGLRVVTASTLGEAADQASQTSFDVIISGGKVGLNSSGSETVKALKSHQPEAEVILLASLSARESATDALAAGAFAYLSRPFRKEELLLQVGRALGHRDLARENQQFRRQLQSRAEVSELIGPSAAMVEVRKKVAMASSSWSPVLLTGETGTGKSFVARMIHDGGSRASQPFCIAPCGAMDSLGLESELFGKSSPAVPDGRPSLLEEASGGTVFLNDVAALSPSLQAKLARTLTQRKFKPAGSSRPISLDVRFIAATRRPLVEAVKRGTFLEDLYDRLRVFEIDLPPLRSRTEDIPLLVAHFLAHHEQQRARACVVSSRALTALIGYAWPGNVRELQRALDVALAQSRGGDITPECLPLEVRAVLGDVRNYEDFFSDLPSLDGLARRYLRYVLEMTGGNKSRTAAILEINRKTLYRIAERSRRPKR